MSRGAECEHFLQTRDWREPCRGTHLGMLDLKLVLVVVEDDAVEQDVTGWSSEPSFRFLPRLANPDC